MLPVPRFPKAILAASALALLLLFFVHWSGPRSWILQQQQQQQQQVGQNSPLSADNTEDGSRDHGKSRPGGNNNDITTNTADLPCQNLPGADDVLVIMRTGATELADKLTMSFSSTFHCYKHLLIFSDYAEMYEGHQIHDVLIDVPDVIKKVHPDFVHYNRVAEIGRENLSASELSGNVSWESGPIGKNYNAGWRLDKWKFVPMINATAHMYPDKKWYVFVEPDTYLVWSNLLKWLSSGIDPAQPFYFGSEVQIGDDIFAHGGSAFVLSQPAVKMAADRYQHHEQEVLDFTATHWAGDCVLGKVLRDAGVDLTFSWPMFQGGNPALLEWEEEKGDQRLWCAPAMSYHHVSPQEKLRLFEFEQNWIRAQQPISSTSFANPSPETILHHRDLFKSFQRPEMTAHEKPNWNSAPPHDVDTDDCRQFCQLDSDCLTYTVGPEGCTIGKGLRLGQYKPGFTSGWMLDRIDAAVASLDSCTGEGWIAP